MTNFFPTIDVDIEFTTGVWTPIKAYVSKISTRRGRSTLLGGYQAGTCNVTLDNSSGRFYPLDSASPYYPNVIPGRQIRVVVTLVGGAQWQLFQGYIETWPPAWPSAFGEEATITAVDAFKVLGLHDYRASRPAETTYRRALDVGLDTGVTIYAGGSALTTVAAQDVDSKALYHLQEMETSENGQLYVDTFNQVAFESRNFRALNRGTVVQTLTDDADAVGGSGILYDDLVPSYDDQEIFNEWTVTADRADTPTIATVSDATSIGKYFKRSNSRTINTKNGLEANDAANWLVNRYKDPGLRFDQLVVRPAFPDGASTGYALCASAQFGELWRVLRHPPHGSTIDVNLRMESVAHDISLEGPQGDWTTSFGMSADIGSRVWVLGDASNGQLNQSTILGY